MRTHLPLSLSSLVRRGGEAVLRALLPASCALCGASCASVLCLPCQQQYFGAGPLRCRQCANPFEAGEAALLCGRCLRQVPAFDATLTAASYMAPVDQLVMQLKFGGKLALSGLFAQLLRDAVLEQPGFLLPAVLCPVPLGAQRLAGRGFNQALEIARPLARQLGVPLYPTLAARVRETQAQSSLTPAERGSNMRQAFVILPASLDIIRGRHVGVVDDVMTSGETLSALAATFKRHGAARVTNFVFARTPPR
jgi:ComF family protein